MILFLLKKSLGTQKNYFFTINFSLFFYLKKEIIIIIYLTSFTLTNVLLPAKQRSTGYRSVNLN